MKKYSLIVFLMLSLSEVKSQPVDSIHYLGGVQRFRLKKLVIPAVLITAGSIINNNATEGLKMEVAEERNEWMPGFSTHIDDYLQYAPIAIAFGLDALGVKSKTDLPNRTVILLKSELLMLSVTQVTKHLTKQKRPDGSNDASFPSGHTAQAFAAATFLNEEYKHRYPWIPYLSYGIASSVGCLRIANNKHYLSDVIVGAGLGILSTRIAYWTHAYKWGTKKSIKSIAFN